MNFSAPLGSFDREVVGFETDRIFGTDSLYCYLGDYAPTGTVASGKVEVIRNSGPQSNIFGPTPCGHVRMFAPGEGDGWHCPREQRARNTFGSN